MRLLRLLAKTSRSAIGFKRTPMAPLAVPRAASVATTPAQDSNANAQNHESYRAHIDFKFVRDNVDLVRQNATNRLVNASPDEVVRLYDEFVALTQESDAVRAARNENSAQMKRKLEADEREKLIEHGKSLKLELDTIDEKLRAVEARLQIEGKKLPNLTHPDVPIGAEDEATLIAEIGSKAAFGFEAKDHVTLGEALGVLDFDTGSVVSGSKFYYLRKEAALLEMALVRGRSVLVFPLMRSPVAFLADTRALFFSRSRFLAFSRSPHLTPTLILARVLQVNYAMQKICSKGFDPIITPDLVRSSVLEKCGFQPRGEGTQVYSVENSELCLTGTAEIPLGGMFMDQILPEESLPIKVAAYGRCFRTEAGAAGAAGKGLYRVHQFSKVEMFVVCTPEQSEQLHKELIDIEVEMFQELGLHFQVLDMPSCDLGAPAYRKFDIEAWMPGLQRYGEVSSASNCTDYQSRRLNIRYRPSEPASEGGKNKKKKKAPTQFVHTLNGTGCAVPRMIVAILENNQQEDGSIVIPEALRPFMMGRSRIEA